MLAPRMFHSRLVCRSALRPVSRFPCSPWMVVTPSTTMASADFCAVVRRPLGPLSPFRDTTQTSPGKYVDFPCTPASFTVLAFDRMGLRCYTPTRPASQPLMRFVSLRSQVCLRLPSDPASRRRPCLQLTVGAINLRKGLSPSSQRPCRAHVNYPAASYGALVPQQKLTFVSFLFLILNVFPYHLCCHFISYTSYKVPGPPEFSSPQSFA